MPAREVAVQGRVVLDDQDLRHDSPKGAATVASLASGNVKVKVVPRTPPLSAQIRPPWACTRCLAIARPRPVPPLERERSLLKKRSKTLSQVVRRDADRRCRRR